MKLNDLIDELIKLRDQENCGEWQVGSIDPDYTTFDTVTSVDIRDGCFVVLIGEG